MTKNEAIHRYVRAEAKIDRLAALGVDPDIEMLTKMSEVLAR